VSAIHELVEIGRREEAKAGPCPYPVGTRVRVRVRVVEDGQTAKVWRGGLGVVVEAHVAPGRSYWRVVVAHENGRDVARFDETEIDRRYGPQRRGPA